MDLKPGDVVYHKATDKKCVIRAIVAGEKVEVTTKDGKEALYFAKVKNFSG